MQLQLMLSESSIQKLAKNVVPILESKHKYLLQQGEKNQLCSNYCTTFAKSFYICPDPSLYLHKCKVIC